MSTNHADATGVGRKMQELIIFLLAKNFLLETFIIPGAMSRAECLANFDPRCFGMAISEMPLSR